MKISVLLLPLMIVKAASASIAGSEKVNSDADERLKSCMNITYSPDVTYCMMKAAEKAEDEYNKQFEEYLESTYNQEEITHNKMEIGLLAKKAKRGWDIYMENECLAEASVYEKNNYSYNSTYNICLVEKYSARIKYYKESKF